LYDSPSRVHTSQEFNFCAIRHGAFSFQTQLAIISVQVAVLRGRPGGRFGSILRVIPFLDAELFDASVGVAPIEAKDNRKIFVIPFQELDQSTDGGCVPDFLEGAGFSLCRVNQGFHVAFSSLEITFASWHTPYHNIDIISSVLSKIIDFL
jgi:hypothetical protein